MPVTASTVLNLLPPPTMRAKPTNTGNTAAITSSTAIPMRTNIFRVQSLCEVCCYAVHYENLWLLGWGGGTKVRDGRGPGER
jgi:hypothetical protein